MATGIYNGFNGDLRDKVGQLQDLFIRDGYMPPATECYMCHQTQGRIVYHLEDYTDVLNAETPMCFMCHMVLHCCRKGPEDYRSPQRKAAWEEYCKAVENGYQHLLTHPAPLFGALDRGSALL